MTSTRITWLLPLCLFALAACQRQKPPERVPRPVVTTTVQTGADAGLRIYSGEVRARHEVDLGFRVPGKLVERPVVQGQRVRRGELLARLDPADARLSDESARAQVATAQANLALAKAEYARAQRLLAQRFISQSALDARKTQLDAAESSLQQAQAQQGVSGNQLGYTSLLAGNDGVITATPAEPGQVVAAGQAVVRLADPRELEVLIWVPESRVAEVKVGEAAFVRPWDAQDKTLPARVREVAASADTATRTYAVRVALAQPDASLTLGATAAVAFRHADAQAGVSLPLPALVRKQGATQVWVVAADGTVSPRDVEVAAYRDEVAIVRAGLKPGDRVVTVGAHALSVGEKVRVVDAQAPVALDITR